jgi:hypothetical protein
MQVNLNLWFEPCSCIAACSATSEVECQCVLWLNYSPSLNVTHPRHAKCQMSYGRRSLSRTSAVLPGPGPLAHPLLGTAVGILLAWPA